MEAEADANTAGGPVEGEADCQSGPAEQGGEAGKQGSDVHPHEKQGDDPVDIFPAQLVAMEGGDECICFGLKLQASDFCGGQATRSRLVGRLWYSAASYQINCTHVVIACI